MVRTELRIIKASLLTGITDISVGIFLYIVKLQDWYYDHFHFWGVLGFGMITYAGWHYYFYRRDRK